MFYPGETVVHRFPIPFVSTKINKVVVTYNQGDHVIFERTTHPSYRDGDGGYTLINIIFTQEESLLFENLMDITIQLNVLLFDGTRCASNPLHVKSGKQLVREVVF